MQEKRATEHTAAAAAAAVDEDAAAGGAAAAGDVVAKATVGEGRIEGKDGWVQNSESEQQQYRISSKNHWGESNKAKCCNLEVQQSSYTQLYIATASLHSS